jgi:hypothetical protein
MIFQQLWQARMGKSLQVRLSSWNRAGKMQQRSRCQSSALTRAFAYLSSGGNFYWKLLLEKPIGPVPKKGGGLMIQV